ncbi:hypothetical protein NDU88_010405 [Pleurodeles waltl]|uniref:Uncharacterized protein n=1 Tax=Pleurodeles waltl TaxID=8319 RepID=A0AAV7PVK3_PLEWA|nr:hypothetical protein NDU88_010405 [Pleurodeles waltl]
MKQERTRWPAEVLQLFCILDIRPLVTTEGQSNVPSLPLAGLLPSRVTHPNAEPDSTYPGGTTARNADPEATSVPDIREQEGKGDGERQRTALTGLTGRGAEPAEGENDSEAELGNGEEDLDEDGEPNEEDSGKPRDNSQRCHVPGGAWLSQVRAYLVVKILPNWMRVEKGEGKRNEEPERDREEGELKGGESK